MRNTGGIHARTGHHSDAPGALNFRSGNHADFIGIYRGAGASWLCANNDPRDLTSVIALTDTYVYFSPIFIPERITVTGFVYYQGTQGNFTADATNRIGLYKVTGADGVSYAELVAASSNNASLWKATANSFATEALSATYNAEAGHYVIGYTYQQSAQVTAPTIGYFNGQAWMYTMGVVLPRAFGTTFPWTGHFQTVSTGARSDIPDYVPVRIGANFSGMPYDHWWGLY